MGDIDDIEESIHRTSERFDVLGNALRLKILFFLDEDSVNVSQIASELNRPQGTISHHLRMMRYEDVLESKTKGRKRFYWVKNLDMLEMCKKFLTLLQRDEDKKEEDQETSNN